MKIINMTVKNSSTVNHRRDRIINLLGKEQIGMKLNAWFCQIMIDLLAMDTGVGPNSTKAFCVNQAAIWNLR